MKVCFRKRLPEPQHSVETHNQLSPVPFPDIRKDLNMSLLPHKLKNEIERIDEDKMADPKFILRHLRKNIELAEVLLKPWMLRIEHSGLKTG